VEICDECGGDSDIEILLSPVEAAKFHISSSGQINQGDLG